jgi:hypothetical protein
MTRPINSISVFAALLIALAVLTWVAALDGPDPLGDTGRPAAFGAIVICWALANRQRQSRRPFWVGVGAGVLLIVGALVRLAV